MRPALPVRRVQQGLQSARERKASIDAALAALAQEDAEHVLPAEPDARMMQSRGRAQWAFNAQAVVAEKAGIVVAQEVTNEATDYRQLTPMLEEVRGVVTRDAFEAEVIAKARQSQQLEGFVDPIRQESAETWERRTQTTRDNLTDFYFAYNLPHELFQDIVQALVTQRNPDHKVILTFNPELAPIDLVLAQGEKFEALPPAERNQVRHHLQEITVVLLKALVSDQLAFIRVAKEWFTMADIREIRKRKYGDGKIGGKAAGMLLAWKILQAQAT